MAICKGGNFVLLVSYFVLSIRRENTIITCFKREITLVVICKGVTLCFVLQLRCPFYQERHFLLTVTCFKKRDNTYNNYA